MILCYFYTTKSFCLLIYYQWHSLCITAFALTKIKKKNNSKCLKYKGLYDMFQELAQQAKIKKKVPAKVCLKIHLFQDIRIQNYKTFIHYIVQSRYLYFRGLFS